MKEKYIFFDLDGTLTDPKVGITKSVQYALASFGIQVDSPDELTHFIGPPLRDTLQEYGGFTAEETESAVAKYREYFATTGIFENTLYHGVRPMLQQLQSAGKPIALATSKPALYAGQILEHFAIDGFFAFVAGSEMDGTRSNKAEVIRHALDSLHVPPAEVVMVGDREYDILGAKATGTKSVGVLYGYGSRDELAAAGADAMAASVAELAQMLLCGA